MLHDDAILSACADERFRARFEAKVDRSGSCHVWTGARTSCGYGCIGLPKVGKKSTVVAAHRVAWIMANGLVPPPPSGATSHGMCVLHNCPGGDNPSCVNVSHLFLGTQPGNISDCKRKGRNAQQIGEANGRVILTDSEVREIRERWVPHKGPVGPRGFVTQRQLAAEYRVSESLIEKIVRGKLRRKSS